jgi:hypothetical protein
MCEVVDWFHLVVNRVQWHTLNTEIDVLKSYWAISHVIVELIRFIHCESLKS